MNNYQENENQPVAQTSSDAIASVAAYEKLLAAKEELSAAKVRIAEQTADIKALTAQVEQLSSLHAPLIPKSKAAQHWDNVTAKCNLLMNDFRAAAIGVIVGGLFSLFAAYFKANPSEVIGYVIVALMAWGMFSITKWMICAAVRKTLAAKKDHGWIGFYNVLFFYSILLEFSGTMVLITDRGHGGIAQSLWLMFVSLTVGGFAFWKGRVYANESGESFPNIRTINKYV